MKDKKVGGCGIAALILGILSVAFGWTIIGGIILGIVGIILGIIELTRKTKPAMPIVAIILSGLGVVFAIGSVLSIVTLGEYVIENGDELMSSIEDQFETDEVADVISGYTWEEVDGSLLELKSNNTFRYYRDKNDLSNNYYEGTYKVYCGEEAVKYISEDLSKYNLTEEEQRNIFTRSDIYSINNYYCLVLNNKTCIVNGKNTLANPTLTPYYGFYIDNGILDIANMNTATYYSFKKVD